MTQREWDSKWMDVFIASRKKDPASELLKMHQATTEYMVKQYGSRPSGEPGPPWWMKIGAVAVGVPMDWMSKAWTFMNGKKTIVGAVITLFAYLVAGVPLVAALCTTAVCATTVAKVGGIGLTVLGILHKLYKFFYREEHA